ncbi:nitroreductase family protein [Paenibacillus contaminans]|uniref:Nitroreductase n=1 Tax=Paenibacillus contaminans TaxID=450362 RepID=A0A329LY43_9BACL|nr:nitroreductase family protein [Paenibacillus contaminans]RAV12689.1 nitroreductase [Paenibacillus contaminans]
MEVKQAVTTRRNVKQFKPDPIERELLNGWLEAASYAPNHRMTEPWEILVIGPETRAKLNHKEDFGGAPVVIAVLSTPAQTPFDRDEHVMAVSCFVQNFMLLAHEAGAATRWASFGSSPRNREIMGVPEGFDVIGVFGVGYPAEVPAVKARTPIAEKLRELP